MKNEEVYLTMEQLYEARKLRRWYADWRNAQQHKWDRSVKAYDGYAQELINEVSQ